MPGGRRRRPTGWIAGLAVVGFTVGALLTTTSIVVSGTLLSSDTYTEALVRARAYERTYSEVLADPELAEVTNRILGDFDVEQPLQARVITTNVLRLVLPPSTLRDATETVIESTLAYVRGETDRLDADVGLVQLLARIDTAAVMEARVQLAEVADRLATSVDDYRGSIAAAVDQLVDGTIPASIPVIGASTIDPATATQAILDALGPRADAQLREQIAAAVNAGDERDALVTAVSVLVAEHARVARDDLSASLEDGHQLDLVAELADHIGRPQAEVVATLNGARDVARWFGAPMLLLGVVLMIAAVAALIATYRRHLRRGAEIGALAAIVAGLAAAVVWWGLGALVESPFAPATSTGPGSWHLPAGLRGVFADVERQVGRELHETARRCAVVLLAGGLTLAVAPVIMAHLRTYSRRRAVLGMAGVTTLVVLLVGSGAATVGTAAPQACNGAQALCSRPYDEVVYAATHNSMSTPDVVYAWPEQDSSMREQLDSGVRALLIDTHYWTPLLSPDQLHAIDSVIPPGLATEMFAELAARRASREGTFLCHRHCAMGAIPLVDALRDVGWFLAENPRDVVTLIIQDEITPADTEAAFADAGLLDLVHVHEQGQPWATLGELIDRDERLVVFAENDGGSPAWYHRAFDDISDTPFHVSEPEEFSCARNRGRSDAPLLMLNHWVRRVAPDRVDASIVNRHDVIVSRANECAEVRGQLPNFIVVDFASIGDVVGAVATLNRRE